MMDAGNISALVWKSGANLEISVKIAIFAMMIWSLGVEIRENRTTHSLLANTRPRSLGTFPAGLFLDAKDLTHSMRVLFDVTCTEFSKLKLITVCNFNSEWGRRALRGHMKYKLSLIASYLTDGNGKFALWHHTQSYKMPLSTSIFFFPTSYHRKVIPNFKQFTT